MTTITITKGHQYDRNGYRITHVNGRGETVYGAYGNIGLRMDGTDGITADGGLLVSYDHNHSGQREAVEATIRAVIADGVTRTVDLRTRVEAGIDQPRPEVKMTPRVHGVSGWCDKCQSYCYGDCEAK